MPSRKNNYRVYATVAGKNLGIFETWSGGDGDSDDTPYTEPSEIHGGSVPELHVVRSGDTLWGICWYYFNDPWQWPKIWSYNAQITNPHWTQCTTLEACIVTKGNWRRLRSCMNGHWQVMRRHLGQITHPHWAH